MSWLCKRQLCKRRRRGPVRPWKNLPTVLVQLATQFLDPKDAFRCALVWPGITPQPVRVRIRIGFGPRPACYVALTCLELNSDCGLINLDLSAAPRLKRLVLHLRGDNILHSIKACFLDELAIHGESAYGGRVEVSPKAALAPRLFVLRKAQFSGPQWLSEINSEVSISSCNLDAGSIRALSQNDRVTRLRLTRCGRLGEEFLARTYEVLDLSYSVHDVNRLKDYLDAGYGHTLSSFAASVALGRSLLALDPQALTELGLAFEHILDWEVLAACRRLRSLSLTALYSNSLSDAGLRWLMGYNNSLLETFRLLAPAPVAVLKYFCSTLPRLKFVSLSSKCIPAGWSTNWYIQSLMNCHPEIECVVVDQDTTREVRFSRTNKT